MRYILKDNTLLSNGLMHITLYTDGSCLANPGPGGWGVVLQQGEGLQTFAGHSLQTTNNRMELEAVIQGLKVLTSPCQVTVYTDSEYVRQGITNWMPRWKQNGWKTSTKAAVKNKELWILLEEVALPHLVTWRWVKAHNGDRYNEMADKLAYHQARYAAGLEK